MFRFTLRKQEYLIPVMLLFKALISASDLEIFEAVVMQGYNNTFLTDRMELLLRSFKSHYSLYTGDQCLDYLGRMFRVALGQPDDMNDRELGVYLVRKLVLVHLEDPRDKFRMLM
jgi:DNA-directed RNA polymerase I subunit RPA2